MLDRKKIGWLVMGMLCGATWWGLMGSIETRAQPNPVNDFRLNKAQINLLRSLGMQVAVPTYIPAQFRLSSVNVKLQSNSRIGGMQYQLIYQLFDQDITRCFAIEATNGGIGDIPTGNQSYPINSKVMGKGAIELGQYGESSAPTLLSQWLGEGPFYRFTGAGVIPELARCENISPEEAVKVLESLQYLQP